MGIKDWQAYCAGRRLTLRRKRPNCLCRGSLIPTAGRTAPKVALDRTEDPRESLLDGELRPRSRSWSASALRRHLRIVESAHGTHVTIGGRRLLMLSSNNYLGLAAHPALRRAATEAIERYGVGAGASRLIAGSLAPLHELEAQACAVEGRRSGAGVRFRLSGESRHDHRAHGSGRYHLQRRTQSREPDRRMPPEQSGAAHLSASR